MTPPLVRTPVRITATTSRWDRRLIGHEATAYSGDPERTAVRLLSPLLRLSREARALHHSGYIEAACVTVEEIETPTETVLL